MKKTLITFLICISSVLPCYAFTIPSGAVKLSDNDILQVYFTGKTYTCGFIKKIWTPGRIINNYFLPTKAEISSTKKIIKKTHIAAVKKKLLLQLTTLNNSLSIGTSACLSISAVLTPTPTPSPTPTVPSGGGYFDTHFR